MKPGNFNFNLPDVNVVVHGISFNRVGCCRDAVNTEGRESFREDHSDHELGLADSQDARTLAKVKELCLLLCYCLRRFLMKGWKKVGSRFVEGRSREILMQIRS